MEKEVSEIKGIIEAKEVKQTKKGDDFFAFKINGVNYNWFTAGDDNAKEVVRVLNIGDEVTGFAELTPREGQEPYRNIKSLLRTKVSEELVASTTNATNSPPHTEALPQTKTEDLTFEE